MHIDEKFKDATPASTIGRIKSILSSNGIDTEEYRVASGMKNCYSMRVSVKGADFGANGKGITEELSCASGYAEFMERLQSGYLERRIIRDNLLEYNDAVRMSREEFRAACGRWLSEIAQFVSELLHISLTPEALEQYCFEAEGGDEKTLRVLPFYNAIDDCMTYFPQRFIPTVYSTNGLAAGNTLEEAFVQSFSEVFERHSVLRCFFSNLVPPTIPDSYLQQFTSAYETIEELRSRGLEVMIKDCSFSEPFPLIAAVVIDKSNHSYHVHMGAHPVFEIALERCLTEMFQGKKAQDLVANTSRLFIGDAAKRSTADLVDILTYGFGEYSLAFFTKEPSYPFVPFPDRTKMSNIELLHEIVSYLKEKNYKLLVRDASHLGFHSVRIIIPGMSEALPYNLNDAFPTTKLMYKYRSILRNLAEAPLPDIAEYRLLLQHQVSLYGARMLNYSILSGNTVTGDKARQGFLARMVFAYLEWACHRASSAISYANATVEGFEGEERDYLRCLNTVYAHLLAGKDCAETLSGMRTFYSDAIVDSLQPVFEKGENPFSRFLIRCSPESCPTCAYQGGCHVTENNVLADKVRRAVWDFDNEAAFENLKALFQQAR